MTIRKADIGHLDAIADMAQDQRIRQQAWAPDFWALAPNAREVHPLFLRWTIEGGRSISLVATSERGIDGYAIATPISNTDGDRTQWVIDDLGVTAPRRWMTTGRALLAALAAQATAHGAVRLVAPCAVRDIARRTALDAAGLDIDCWYRHRRLDHGTAPDHDEADDGDSGLPLPHLHGLSTMTRDAASVVAPGAHALLTRPIIAPPGYRPGGTTGLLDPVIGADAHAMVGAVVEAEQRCRERGDVALIAVVGPGEEPLDGLLERRGYTKPVEWWALRPK